MRLRTENWDTLDESQRIAVLKRPQASQDPSIRRDAGNIIAAVRSGGDAALNEFTLKFDGVEPGVLRVDAAEIADADDALTGDQLAAIDFAIANVRRFHEQQVPPPVSIETVPQVRCERISQPLDSVGLYVPAGTAPLPSAAIMLAVPAVIAGCPRIVMCTPPRPDGKADAAVLVAATRSGVDEIYKVGGAQSIAAMAYGTGSIPRVRKILGPGNAWVTAAKSMVSSDPDGAAIDMPAGPSEVLVIADENASAAFVAADLLSQAEHGTDSQVILVTTSEAMATDVQTEIGRQLKSLSRAETAATALQNSRVVITQTLAAAVEVSNRYAPEHLILQIREPRSVLPSIRNAGSVFVGPFTPESVGDYCSGTNHVLPTYGYAASYSGLGVDHYMRQMTIQEVSRSGLASLAPTVLSLAGLEGLDAHAAAVNIRLDNSQ